MRNISFSPVAATSRAAATRSGWRPFGAWIIGIASVALLVAALPLDAQQGDAERGQEMLKSRRCIQCHPIAGEGGGSAPDLGRRAPGDISPAVLAADMWNHGPRMWKAMEASNLPIPMLSGYEVANLYAYFYSLRYFDPKGDAARGQAVFQGKNCSGCHALTAELGAEHPVTDWISLADPILWTQQMWNHAVGMEEAMKAKNVTWPEFNVAEMSDLLAYLESLPELQLVNPGMRVGDWTAGAQVFEDAKCVQCHTIGESVQGKIDLTAVARQNAGLSALAVQILNHEPRMRAEASKRGIELTPLEGDQMADLTAFLFQAGYFEVQGDAKRGEQVYAAKGCNTCHGKMESAAPDLRLLERNLTEIRFSEVVWEHGPTMKVQMDYWEKSWPRLTAQDVADLIAFANQ